MEGQTIEARGETVPGNRDRLMVSGSVTLDPDPRSAVEVRRGMVVRGLDGDAAGEVAALVVAGSTKEVTHLVLRRLTAAPEYRVVPVALIAGVREEDVYLRIHSRTVSTLPRRHPSQPGPHSSERSL